MEELTKVVTEDKIYFMRGGEVIYSVQVKQQDRKPTVYDDWNAARVDDINRRGPSANRNFLITQSEYEGRWQE